MVRFARKLLPPAATYGIAAGLALGFGAPLAALVLGPRYTLIAPVLAWLAPPPLLCACDYVRRELLAAVAGGAIVLPAAVDREFSSIGQLLEALQFLGQRNAVHLRRSGCDESVRAIELAADKALGITRMRDTRY